MLKAPLSGRGLVNILMAAALLILVSWSPEARSLHRRAGGVFFLLAAVHVWQNRAWFARLFRGSWTGARSARTALVFLALVAALAAVGSGVALMRETFGFLGIREGVSAARTIHVASVYWAFALAGLHLGANWGRVSRKIPLPAGVPVGAVWAFALALAAWGLACLVRRDLFLHMFLTVGFVFVDFDRHWALRAADGAAMASLWVALGHCGMKIFAFRKSPAAEGAGSGTGPCGPGATGGGTPGQA
ncbi:MAG: DUF4405 domain-containing protein [Deltaproteobacteria bacterium]|jgi:hypothetical protein|nr:DUF4405 domain-containing protein [Deltaproteobacteria bacterium]